MGAGITGHGLTLREQEIMDRADAGVEPGAIAEELGLSLSYVKGRISYYNSGFDSDAKARRAATIASAGHLAALRAVGGQYT